MKLLLDECTPARLKSDFPGHEVSTIEEARLKGLKNGTLLRIASQEFDVLITVDQKIPYQQNLSDLSIAIVIMVARSNRYPELRSLAPKALKTIASIRKGQIVRITECSSHQGR